MIKHVLLPLSLLAASSLALRGAQHADDPHVSRITLAKGADLEAAVRAVHAAGPSVVVADTSGVDARLAEAMIGVGFEQALSRLSVDYDRACIRRSRTVVLQRRFSHPEEEAGLEMDELRLVAGEMYRLVVPLAPRLRGRANVLAHAAFVDSITPEQQQRMLAGGLPFVELTPEQRGLWIDFTRQQLYDAPERELRRSALLMAAWERVTMEDLQTPAGRLADTLYRFPDPAASGGRDAVQIRIATANLHPRITKAEVETRPTPESPAPAELRSAWTIAPEQMDLSRLVRILADGGFRLAVPEYALRRRFWIASNGGTRGEVLAALGDLWGWSLAAAGTGYRLGRSRARAARDAIELHQKLRAAIPPALLHMARASEEGATDRTARRMDLVFKAAERVAGADWKRLQVTRLDADSQVRLANQLLRQQILQWWKLHGRLEQPLDAHVHPERGIMVLSGPLGAGNHPLLRIRVRDASGRTTGWGWFVGTAELSP